ncbi:phenylalanine--tRNA ligase subunit beta [Basilea psittacipulmonis]|uniref:Phenylalanine--tRNA ligase beta subunit n=1 Tax=Basilea psittacipulmonis DSM 24701 TaxID=1072685 RepID=A0A077DG70_9BURK|nr:phenylalanine--tRNA ligase subunit beta [Basilea psittacipulmonis]AIL33171.1 phenylalanyl-tRNA synthetase subunit beta [Basilea psittacipulmonis DSM 24701]
MLFPESWLRAVVNPTQDTEALGHLLTMAGLEIEEIAPVAVPFSGVVVARIEAIEPHPDADKLRVCQVNDGSGTLLQVVCGAPNAAKGLTVPLARIGAQLPGGIKISKGKLRGVESFGMLCSATEIGMTQEHDGLLVLDPEQVELGQDIRDVFRLDEQIFELKITPNRADCLSIKGVAREVGALTGAKVKEFDFTPVPATISDVIPVTVNAPDLCGRFAGRVIRGVNAHTPTPAWMKERLERSGQRSVNVLVDISNYVMLELGTPSHIFDLDKMATKAITVDWAKSGETLTLLNNETVTLDEKVGVVYAGTKPEAMAGVMGGLEASVSEETQHIFVEQAFWHPAAIAGLTRRFKLNSEAAHRFERGVDFACLTDHLEYLTRLIVTICGGEVGPLQDQVVNLPKRQPVSMRVSRCQKILGVDIPSERIAEIFTDLAFDYQFKDGVFTVQSPSWRFDIEIEEDLIEEVARIYGFDNIPANPPVAPAVMLPTYEKKGRPHHIRDLMVAQDYQEVVNYSFVPESWEKDFVSNDDPIRLLNPIASQLSVMRSSLLAGLVDNVVFNAKRQLNRVRVFELGAVFSKDEKVVSGDLTVKGVRQVPHLAAVAWGPAFPEQWGVAHRNVDFYDVKADLCQLFPAQNDVKFQSKAFPALHPGRSAAVIYQGKEIGFIGELHPSLVQKYDLTNAPVVFEVEFAAFENVPLPRVKEYSKQPQVIRDLAIWAPKSLELSSLLETLKRAKNEELKRIKEVTLFDVWKDPNSNTDERSLALRFVLQDTQHTLEDAQVEQTMAAVLKLWTETYSVRQR